MDKGQVKMDPEIKRWVFNELTTNTGNASNSSNAENTITNQNPDHTQNLPDSQMQLIENIPSGAYDKIEDQITIWGIDIFQVFANYPHPLRTVTMLAIQRFLGNNTFGIPVESISRFLETCESKYQSNPYHSSVLLFC